MPRSWVRAGPGKPRRGTDMPPRYFILSDRCVVGKSFPASCPAPVPRVMQLKAEKEAARGGCRAPAGSCLLEQCPFPGGPPAFKYHLHLDSSTLMSLVWILSLLQTHQPAPHMTSQCPTGFLTKICRMEASIPDRANPLLPQSPPLG